MAISRQRSLAALALVVLAGLLGPSSVRAAQIQVRPSSVVAQAAGASRLLLDVGHRAALRGHVAAGTALPARGSLRIRLRGKARVRVFAGCGARPRRILTRRVPAGRRTLPIGRVSARAWCFAVAADRRVAIDGPRSANPPILLLSAAAASAKPAPASPVAPAANPAPRPAATPAPAPAPPVAAAPPAAVPFFGARDSFWNAPLPVDVAIDAAETAAVAADLPGEISPSNRAYINTTSYSSPITVVDPSTPRVPVQLMAPAWNGVVPRYNLTLASVLAAGVPIPAGYQPAPAGDTDAEASFYCPRCVTADGKVGVLWELWRLRKTASGGWTAQYGGRMTATTSNPGHWVDRSNGAAYPALPKSAAGAASFESRLWGATATSLPLAAGEIRLADLQRGYIDHALGLAVRDASLRKGFRWPAQRGDGWRETGALQEGMRLRLPPGYTIPSSLSPVARMIAQAARDYGLVVWDRAGALSLRAEPAVRAHFGSMAPSSVLDGFPWAALQVIKTGSDVRPNPTG